MSILEKILYQKKKEVAHLIINGIKGFPDTEHNISSINQTFPSSEHMNIIAEIKRASPSKGAIDMAVDPVEQAIQYEALGASAISILTDNTFFKGSIDDLHAVRKAVDLPLLCKDFIIDPIQIDQAKAAGANIVLLIVAALTEDELKTLYRYAKDLNIDVLCEVHNESEMIRAVAIDADIIGINNRDLRTFDVDLSVAERLAPMIQNPSTVIIGESGIKSQKDVKRLTKSGVSGILVGETLMRTENLKETFKDLRINLTNRKIPHAR